MKRFLLILFSISLVLASQAQTNNKIRALQNRRKMIQKEIIQREHLLRSTKKDVSHQLQNLNTLSGQIDERKKYIYIIGNDVKTIGDEVNNLSNQLQGLQNELNNKKHRYAESLKYIYHHKTIEEKLMFIFSAKSLAQGYRRMLYVSQYGNYQKKIAYELMNQQRIIANKKMELEGVKHAKSRLLDEGVQQKKTLEGQKTEKRQLVISLQSKQKDLQIEIGKRRKQSQQLNSQIDRIVAIEVEAARKRAEAEAKEKAVRIAAERAAARKEAAKRAAAAKAAAERAAAQRVAAEKAAAEKTASAKAAHERALAAKNVKEKQAAEEIAKQQTEEARKAEENVKEAKTAEAKAEEVAKKEKETPAPAPTYNLDRADQSLSGSFVRNKGHFPMPMTGSCMVINHFGQYSVKGLRNVQLDNKGIDIQGHAGAMARCIYDGEVAFVFQMNGLSNIIVRHGSYLSVYCNLSSVSVTRGQKVHTGQIIGRVYSDSSDDNRTVLHFQLRHETAKLNPETWLR